MTSPSTTTGTVPFKVPGLDRECFTWFKVFGDLGNGVRPLIALHGGPGVGHNYLLSLADLAITRPVILYDQLGCGNSTLLPEKNGDTTFWTVQLFLKELENLVENFKIESYDLFGNSWGGMLAAEHALTDPQKLHKLIIADSPASMVDWVIAANKLRAELPKEVQEVLLKHETDGTTDSSEYEAAVEVFYGLHVCRLKPWPSEVVDTFNNIKKDSTVYMTMNGPSEFFVIGSLKDWSIKKELGNIAVPTLLLNGRYDEATDWVLKPYFDEIPRVRWYTFAQSSHMPHWEERTRFMEVVGEFLEG
ncbi:proline iminopeptidase [Venturia nashicola]|nr:proline iminopeptidase [Venturia nashicola]